MAGFTTFVRHLQAKHQPRKHTRDEEIMLMLSSAKTTNSTCWFKPGGHTLFLGDSLFFSYKDLDVERVGKTLCFDLKLKLCYHAIARTFLQGKCSKCSPLASTDCRERQILHWQAFCFLRFLSDLLFSINKHWVSSVSTLSRNLEVAACVGRWVSHLCHQHCRALGHIFLFLHIRSRSSNLRYNPDILDFHFFTHTMPGAMSRLTSLTPTRDLTRKQYKLSPFIYFCKCPCEHSNVYMFSCDTLKLTNMIEYSILAENPIFLS